MLGAIIGDIVGSIYEWNNIKTKEFPLFRDNRSFTDDTVMTCAVADAIMNGGLRDDFIDSMKKYGRMYPDAGYGGRFSGWLYYDSREPYNSFGNAISLGGDSDTLAAITGSIAEAAYGIPDWIKEKAWSYLDEPLRDVLRRWKRYLSPSNL